MKAVIMAGGFGTRLRPLTSNLPKPMVPMANKPMMEHIVNLLKQHGFTELVVLLFFQAEVIQDYFGDGERFGVRMSYLIPQEDYGTAGAVKMAEELAGDGTVVVISGDVLTDFDLTKALSFHRDRGSKATILLTRVENPLPFGIVITDPAGRIEKFLEKPSWGEVFSDTINTGIYILESEVFRHIPRASEFDFSKDLFPRLMLDGVPLYGAVMDGYWKDVGNLAEYQLAHRHILERAVSVRFDGDRAGGRELYIGKDSSMDISVDARGTVLVGSDCRIGKNVRIENTVIGSNCVIEDDADLRGAVLWDHVYVGTGAHLAESVVASHCVVKEGASLADGVIVSDACTIGRHASLGSGVKVWPRKIVEDGATLATSLVWGEKWSRSIFGPYGVNGLANFEITPEFAARLGAAFGATFRKGSIVATSRDQHPASRMINRAFMTGVLSTGVNVYDYGIVPIPLARFLVKGEKGAGGVYTRRSPFDRELIDMKFFEERGIDLPTAKEKAIERFFFGEDFRRVVINETGEIYFPSHVEERYRRGFLGHFNVDAVAAREFKIVMDFSHGPSSSIFPNLLGKMNCDVIALNANQQAEQLTKTAADFESALRQLSNIVVSLKADLGFFLDAGGEKIVLVDHKGEVYPGEVLLPVLLDMLLEQGGPQAVSVPVNASMLVETIAGRRSASVRRTRTNDRALMEAALSQSGGVVGENTGGFIFPSFLPSYDGMFTIAKILELTALLKTTVNEVHRLLPATFMLRDAVPCSWECKGRAMRYLLEQTAGERVELVDGIKIWDGDGWCLAIPSPDKAYFDVWAESPTRRHAEELLAKVGALVAASVNERGGV